ncbi:MAG: methyl-accepting chemotaxis protein, partial [Burkholderiaceae bacterium]|nr:methyl-accepting chemotaxis protein [Burkholderiaceae bacterium]
SQVRSGTQSVTAASTEIAQGNLDLSHRTEQTSSNLQEMAVAIDELTRTVTQSTESAQRAAHLAQTVSNSANLGGDVVAKVAKNMSQITEHSKHIGDIVGIIDGIAFQTNILALNAAVEAARAGEQGRGFAVVASEVRTLAQRSAQSAKEIKELIQASETSVGVGATLVGQSGDVMREMVQGVQQVSQLIAEIAGMAQSQRDGISQVQMAVGQLDQMTQQNAALVDESAASAHSMNEQAQKLSSLVGQFRL